MKVKKLWLWLSSGVVVLIILTIVGPKLGLIEKGKVYEVQTAKATKRTIIEVITASGKIQPEIEVKISSDVSGEIVELMVKEGDEVVKGQLLAKIKPDVYLSSLQRMEASLESAKANLGNARARLAQIEAQYFQTELTFNRSKKLFEQGAISNAEYDNSLSSYKMAKAEVEAARQSVLAAEYTVKSTEASLNEAKANLIKTNIYAPMSGTISKLNVKLGERVVGTMQMAGTEMMRIADLNVMEVIVTVNENDIVRIHMHDTAYIEVDAYANELFKGVVTSIANSSSNTNSGLTSTVNTDQVASYEVKIRILPESYQKLIGPSNRYPFRPGMSATVDVHTKTEYNIVAIPVQAVTTRPDSLFNSSDSLHLFEQKKKLVECVFKVKNDNTVDLIAVETGIQDDQWIHIKSGINENDIVVKGPFSILSKKLNSGDKIKTSEVNVSSELK